MKYTRSNRCNSTNRIKTLIDPVHILITVPIDYAMCKVGYLTCRSGRGALSPGTSSSRCRVADRSEAAGPAARRSARSDLAAAARRRDPPENPASQAPAPVAG